VNGDEEAFVDADEDDDDDDDEEVALADFDDKPLSTMLVD
jgi:hypothetical protein